MRSAGCPRPGPAGAGGQDRLTIIGAGLRQSKGSYVADTFDLLNVLEEWQAHGQPYYEFLLRPSLSAGIYRLEPGEPDRQRPHTEDEAYYVLSGEGAIDVDGEVTPLRPGSFVFVEKQLRHHFLDYPEGLTLLVIFAPARGSGAT